MILILVYCYRYFRFSIRKIHDPFSPYYLLYTQEQGRIIPKQFRVNSEITCRHVTHMGTIPVNVNINHTIHTRGIDIIDIPLPP